MKKLIKSSRFAVLLAIVLFILPSCEKDEEQVGLQVKFQATQNILKNSSVVDFTVESFMVNVEEIELEFDESDPLFETDTIASDIELEGPFEVDLMKGGNPFSTIVAKNIILPQAAYDELEFEFKKSKNSISSLLGKTILIKGTIAGKPFVFWSDKEAEIELEFAKNVFLTQEQVANIIVSFDIMSLFNPLLGGADITGAVDGNNNGIIEIYPNDPDGNDELSDMLWDSIEEIIDAFEDENDK